MLFHLAPLCEGKRARFLKQARWQTDLPDVVNKSAEVSKLLFFRTHA
jgi:hypothetical protein